MHGLLEFHATYDKPAVIQADVTEPLSIVIQWPASLVTHNLHVTFPNLSIPVTHNIQDIACLYLIHLFF